MTRDLITQLHALAAALDARLVIVRVVVDEEGKTIAAYRKSAVLPKEDR